MNKQDKQKRNSEAKFKRRQERKSKTKPIKDEPATNYQLKYFAS